MKALDRKIGRNVSALRNRKRISQLELSSLIGISRASISNIENGRHTLTVHMMIKMCQELDCTPNEILNFLITNTGTPEYSVYTLTISNEDVLKIVNSNDPCLCKENRIKTEANEKNIRTPYPTSS